MSPHKLKKLREKQHLEKVKEEKELQTELGQIQRLELLDKECDRVLASVL